MFFTNKAERSFNQKELCRLMYTLWNFLYALIFKIQVQHESIQIATLSYCQY